MKSTFLKKYPLSLLTAAVIISSSVSHTAHLTAATQQALTYGLNSQKFGTRNINNDMSVNPCEGMTPNDLDEYVHSFFDEAFFSIQNSDKRSFQSLIGGLVTFVNENRDLFQAKFVTRGGTTPTLNQFIQTLETIKNEKNTFAILAKLKPYIKFLPPHTQNLINNQGLKLLSGLKRRLAY